MNCSEVSCRLDLFPLVWLLFSFTTEISLSVTTKSSPQVPLEVVASGVHYRYLIVFLKSKTPNPKHLVPEVLD